MLRVAQSRRILIVSVVSCLFVAPAGISAGQSADQAAAASIVGSVTILGGSDAIGDVEVTVVGPMEGQAKAALASFPLMAVEIAETLSIPRFTTATGADGRFVVQNLAPGLYSVLGEAEGLRRAGKARRPADIAAGHGNHHRRGEGARRGSAVDGPGRGQTAASVGSAPAVERADCRAMFVIGTRRPTCGQPALRAE